MAIIFGEQVVTIKPLEIDFSYSTLGVDASEVIDLGASEYVKFGPGLLGAFQALRDVAFVDVPSVTEDSVVFPPNADPPFPPVWPYTWNTSLLYGREHLGQNLKMVRGDTYSFRVTITQNGEAVDITGGSFTMTAKWEITDADANAVFQKTSPSGGIVLTTPASGVITVTLDPADTNSLPLHKVSLFYDIEFIDSSGDVYTVLYGTLSVVPDVTLA